MTLANLTTAVLSGLNEAQLDTYDYGTTVSYGSNISTAWDYATGAGITVAVVDDGFTASVITNFSSADSESLGTAGLAEPTGATHGTETSAMIGGSGVDGTAVGAAPDATVIGLKVDMGNTSFSEFVDAMQAGGTLASVVNNSWSFGGFGVGEPDQGGASDWYAAVQSAVQTGRDGLGTVIVVAAGNDRQDGNNVGVQPIADDPRVIAVAASTSSGTVATFSNPGAGLLVAAVGLNVTVATPAGVTAVASGTSFSAPTVSAIFTMMLQANPTLGWRDIQEILADSAYAPAPSAAGFTVNGATDWNGGGMQFSNDLGFGVVDANVAVNLARAWTQQSTSANLDTQVVTQSTGFGVAINGSAQSTVADTSSERVQHVQVQLTDTGLLAANTQLVLISPDGTKSVLLNDTGLANGTDETHGMDLSGDAVTSNAFWGENAAGNWTLQVQDTNGTVVGAVQNWNLTVWGDAGAGAAPLVYTPEFALVAAQDAVRTVLVPDATTTIDLIGLTNTTNINLNGGAGMIDGVGVTLQAGLTTANADGSTGMTVITAATAGSTITGGDGITVVYGAGGDDTVVAGLGLTVIWSGADPVMNFTAGSGTSAVQAGSGQTNITEGSGANQLILTNGSSGGLNVVTGFNAGLDTVHLVSYSAGAAAAAFTAQTSDSHGGTLMSLADGSRIDFLGVAHVNQSVFA